MRREDPSRRDPSAPATRIALCGRVRVEIEGREVALPTGQAARSFSFLMARPDLRATREELIDAAWPEQPPRDPLTAVRPVLSRLRRTLEPAELEGRDQLRLAFPQPVSIDVAESRASRSRSAPPAPPASRASAGPAGSPTRA